MKKYLVMIATIALLAGCQTPGKLIATSSITVDHAMQAWAVYVVDGHATTEQRQKVSELLNEYQMAEDAVLEAYVLYYKFDNTTSLASAKELLLANQSKLINLIQTFTGKEVAP